MHQMLNNGFGSGIVFENLSPSCVCEALVMASDNLSELQHKAGRGMAKWRKEQSTTALVEMLASKLNQ